MFAKYKLLIGGLVFLGLISSIGTLSFMLKAVKAERDMYQQQVSQERANHQITKRTLANYQQQCTKSQEDYRARMDVLQASYDTERGKVNELEEVLSQHDLAYLAKKKPGLIANRINRGTARLFAVFEEISNTPSD